VDISKLLLGITKKLSPANTGRVVDILKLSPVSTDYNDVILKIFTAGTREMSEELRATIVLSPPSTVLIRVVKIF